MTLGQKILKYDETDQTAKDFRDMFNIALNVPESTEVLIGLPSTGNMREVFIGGNLELLDLALEGTDVRYEKSRRGVG